MQIERIEFCNFRNLKRQTLEFSPRTNLLVGQNAQGKTNIIEAIFIVCTGHSFRTANLKDTIKRDEESAWIKAIFKKETSVDERLSKITLTGTAHFRNSKKMRVRGANAVVFAPEEIVLLRDSPSARRRYFDRIFSALDSEYGSTLRKYERVVWQRNRLLKDTAPFENLHPWDEQLSMLGSKLILRRAMWCARLNEHIPASHEAISPSEKARLNYAPHTGGEKIREGQEAIGEEIKKGLALRRKDEMERRVTLVGPHRDDFDAMVNESSLKRFGSQGQHRTFVLGLKGAEMNLIEIETGTAPILILDDVSSELDADRQEFLLKKIEETNCQVFITSTGAFGWDLNRDSKEFVIEEGKFISHTPRPRFQ